MKLGIITDEICKDFREAVEWGIKWNLDYYEVRELQSGRIPYIDKDELRAFINLKKEKNVELSALSPGIFKAPLHNKEIIDEQRKKWIFDTFSLADKLKVNKIIIFGVERYEREPEDNYQTVIDLMGEMSEIARKYGFLICVENEAGHWLDTGENSARILKEIGSEYLRANWDPGNSLLSGEIPYPDGYNYIKEYMANLHIKDYVKNEKDEYEAVPAGEGLIDWKGQLEKISQDLSRDMLTIETHCTPLLEKSEKSITNVRAMLKSLI